MMTQNAGVLLDVIGIEPGEIAYNPAVIVQRNKHTVASGAPVIAVRVENLNSDWLNPKLYNPHIMFFTRQNDALIPLPGTPVFLGCEDPWATWMRGKDREPQLLFGVVKVDFAGKEPVITTQLYLAQSVQDLRTENPIAIIRGMKDVRVAPLLDGRLAVFTRPLTGAAYPGRVGFAIIDSIEEIEKAVINAPLLPFSLDKNERIGVNEAYEIGPSTLHVFCHIARVDPMQQDGREVFDFDRGIIHYSGYQFDLDPNHPYDDNIALHKVADRSNFPINSGPSKGKRYDDVIFPGGTGGLGQTQYYCGVEDAQVGVIDFKK